MVGAISLLGENRSTIVMGWARRGVPWGGVPGVGSGDGGGGGRGRGVGNPLWEGAAGGGENGFIFGVKNGSFLGSKIDPFLGSF